MTQTVEEIIARAMAETRNAHRVASGGEDVGLLMTDHQDASAVVAALKGAGHVIVSVEPTIGQLAAATAVLENSGLIEPKEDSVIEDLASDVHDAMIGWLSGLSRLSG